MEVHTYIMTFLPLTCSPFKHTKAQMQLKVHLVYLTQITAPSTHHKESDCMLECKHCSFIATYLNSLYMLTQHTHQNTFHPTQSPETGTVLNNRCYHWTSHPTKPPCYTTKSNRKYSLVAMQLDFPQPHSLVAMQLDFPQPHSLVAMQLDFPQPHSLVVMQLDFPQLHCCCATLLMYIGQFG